VRLGYGGLSTKHMSVLEGRRNSLLDENASVSSWGVDEEELKERKEVEMDQAEAPQKTSTDDEDMDGYATANEGDVNAAFAYSTQPPLEEHLPPMEEEEEVELDKEDKKKLRATADEGDVNAAFAYSTQPPVEEHLPPIEEEEEVELDKEDKEKLRATADEGDVVYYCTFCTALPALQAFVRSQRRRSSSCKRTSLLPRNHSW
jgi:hypothetical protein